MDRYARNKVGLSSSFELSAWMTRRASVPPSLCPALAGVEDQRGLSLCQPLGHAVHAVSQHQGVRRAHDALQAVAAALLPARSRTYAARAARLAPLCRQSSSHILPSGHRQPSSQTLILNFAQDTFPPSPSPLTHSDLESFRSAFSLPWPSVACWAASFLLDSVELWPSEAACIPHAAAVTTSPRGSLRGSPPQLDQACRLLTGSVQAAVPYKVCVEDHRCTAVPLYRRSCGYPHATRRQASGA